MNDGLHTPGEKLNRGIALISEALIEILNPVIEAAKSYMSNLGNVINQLQTEELDAISWGRYERPTWYAIYCRTKKKRTRKKYRDKIIREHRRIKADGES